MDEDRETKGPSGVRRLLMEEPQLTLPAASCSLDSLSNTTTVVSATSPCGCSCATKNAKDSLIFAGTSGQRLTSRICAELGVTPGNLDVTRYADGEVCINFRDSIRGKNVYIVQSTGPPVNENLVELLLTMSACKRSSAKTITAVIPYYGYARQDRRMNSRVPISAADVALMIETMGADRVMSVDLHAGQIQGFFRPAVPVDNFDASGVALPPFIAKKLKNPVVVSPDAGGVYRARKFQESLHEAGFEHCRFAMMIKQRTRPNEIASLDLVGSVEGGDAIIIDDIIDTAGTLCEAAERLKLAGAERVFAFATHGLFTGPALDRIHKSCLAEVWVTDSIEQRPEVVASGRIKQLSIAPLLARVISRVSQKASVEALFKGGGGPPATAKHPGSGAMTGGGSDHSSTATHHSSVAGGMYGGSRAEAGGPSSQL